MTAEGAAGDSQAADVLLRYARAIDQRRWDELASCFAPEVWVDAAALNGRPPERVPADELVARIRRFQMRFSATMHYVSNVETSPGGEGGGVDVRAAYRARHVHGPAKAGAWVEDGGWYRHRMTATDERLVIDRYAIDVVWVDGRADLLRVEA